MRYLHDLNKIVEYISARSPKAGMRLYERIDRQGDKLADPNFPHRQGRAPGTRELVAHPNYVVVFRENESVVLILRVIHARQAYPRQSHHS